MTKHNFDAVIFDLDGVITKTALVHSVAWTTMFNDYLKYRVEKHGEKFIEFTHAGDYLPFVDGKPRYKGVADFLASRKINIPFGDPSDDTEKETVCGLGNRKNNYFNEILERDGVEVYESTVELLESLKKENIRIGVASSSKNCEKVLNTAKLMHFFETRVDGVVSVELGLNGKPESDIFTTACNNLGVAYDRAVVVEDAVSGVQAGAKGGFGFTLGLDREGNREALEKNGADIVLNDIDELGGIEFIDEWFENKVPELKWTLLYHDYDPEKEKSRESLLTVGNGFFGCRGSMEEARASESNYPANYMAGLFNRRKSKVGDRLIENEDFVNFIDWVYVNFKLKDSDWFDLNKDKFTLQERKLDLKTGLYCREIIVHHSDGKKTKVESKRFASMDNPHIAGLEYKITALNYSGELTVRSEINGNVVNEGVDRYKTLDQNHLEIVNQGRNDECNYVSVRTNQSDIQISIAEKLEMISDEEIQVESTFKDESGKTISDFSFMLNEGQEVSLQKLVSVHSSNHFEDKNPLENALADLNSDITLDGEIFKSINAWGDIWAKSDVKIEGDRLSQMLVRLHIYHLFVTASKFNESIDAGIPARGLHGEAYRGHIFWDELYALPFYISQFPEIAKSVLMYRYRRLDKAREYAREYGYKGAMFPWQSGSDGREETQIVHLNPVSGEWGEDFSSLQRHISIANAYNIWEYYHISGDQEFMNSYGAEMFFEICRFWASKAEFDSVSERYSIDKVMGPDEFHEKLPGSEIGGLKDNAYTNLMVVWCLNRAFDVLDEMDYDVKTKLISKIDLNSGELVQWKDISMNMRVSINEEGIIEQFDGYFPLEELDWDFYKEKYGNPHRMDRILKAEGKSPDDYKIAKQADTLMTYYNLEETVIEDIIRYLGYPTIENRLSKNFHYYLPRTSHGSTLSKVVHAYMAKLTGNKKICWDMYNEALLSDYNDIQGGTTAEGIHAGVMGGTVLSALTIFGGINWHGDALRIDPVLPDNWKVLSFNFKFKSEDYSFRVSKDSLEIGFNSRKTEAGRIFVRGKRYELNNNKKLIVSL
ncbi:MAG: HAD-IA family hydrolase [Bacteroidales bacterium]|nr:HAD-IA family hydrolase [Bacteroidales bacterium]